MPQNNHVKGTALREHVRGNTLPRLQTHAAAWEHHVFFIGAVPPSLRCRRPLDHLYHSSRRRGYASQKGKHFSKSGDERAARHQRGRGDGMEVKAWAQVAISLTMVHPSCTVAHHVQEAKTVHRNGLQKGDIHIGGQESTCEMEALTANMPSPSLLPAHSFLWKLYADLDLSRRPANCGVGDLGQRLLV
jgi:hypothetical protein